MKLTTTDKTILEKTVNITLTSDNKNIGVRFYVNNVSNLSYIRLTLSNTTNYSKSFEYAMLTTEIVNSGWNFIKIPQKDFKTVGTPNWKDNIVRMALEAKPATGKTVNVTFDSIYANLTTLPTICITFDDGLTGSQPGIDYMNNKNMTGTVYVNSEVVGSSNAYLSLADLQELETMGWCVGNHGSTHADFTQQTDNQIISNITTCKEYLEDNNLSCGALHVAYPYGYWNENVVDVMESLNVKTGRTGNGGWINTPHIYPSLYELNCYSVIATMTLTTAKSIVKKSYDRGSSLFLVFHRIVDSETVTGTDWKLSDFMELVDYIKSLYVRVLTVDEWYNQLSNIRFKSEPVNRREVSNRRMVNGRSVV